MTIYVQLPPVSGGGGSGAVDSVNGYIGIVSLSKTDLNLGNVDNTSDANKPVSSGTTTALATKQDVITGNNNSFLGLDATGNPAPIPGWGFNPLNGRDVYLDGLSTNLSQNNPLEISNFAINATVNSPNEAWTKTSESINLDTNNDGFQLGSSGNGATFNGRSFYHFGKSNTGELVFENNYLNLGNGTDPISVRGISYAYGFANINSGVTLNGTLQGYGFQPAIDAGATLTNGTRPFYDNANCATSAPGWDSFSANPIIANISNNNNYVGFNLNPNIGSMSGNATFFGATLNGNIGVINNGYVGLNISPSVAGANYATGLYINMGGITSSNKKAIDANGDVNINGALTFSGALSIGQLSAYYGVNPVDGGGNPATVHGLISGVTALNGVTVANADTIGVNTAMLITLEANSHTTSGPFGLGLAALALPCVVETHTGSTLDHMTCAAYALNLSGTSTGGTIDEVVLCRTIAIPNGITTVNKLTGFQMDLPFGDVGTEIKGVRILPVNAQNFMAGQLKIGGAETVTNSSTALEIESTTKAFVNARMTTVQRNALTAINGMQIYNTTTDKLQVYAAGSWVDLH